ncbi:MAG: gamma-glutamyltransferase [Proteobacteria bacterium]|nr:gamma-glutamyltransferase [Pseudomonadota bacterium]
MKNYHRISMFFSALLIVSCASQSTKTGSNNALPAPSSSKTARGKTFAIATQGPYSAQAARKVMEAGGNLIDAFVATSFTIAVELPYSTGIGGGGFALVYHAPSKNVTAFDFRERAPMATHSKIFLKGKEVDSEASKTGGLAAGVPGLVAGVLEIHNLYGKLPRAMVIAPAIELAENGFIVNDRFAERIKDNSERLSHYRASKELYFKADGSPLQKGDLFVQKDLAKTLKLIAEKGRRGFYGGETAVKIVNYLKPNGGVMETSDIYNYHAKIRKPLRNTYKGFEVIGMPPPSSGGLITQQILNLLENEELQKSSASDIKNIHKTVAAMQLAFADRGKYYGDTDYVKMPMSSLMSKEYALERKKLFQSDRALKAEEILPGDLKIRESDHTIHFSMADSEGNVISSTQTINGHFGNAMVIPGTGILMNNEMDDFAAKEGDANMFGAFGSKANLVAPGKRPLSSMAPTLVMKDGKIIYALGSPDGTRIISCVTLTLLNLMEYGMDLDDAIEAPRYHHQWRPDTLRVEPSISGSNKDKLTKLGYVLEEKPSTCSVQGVKITDSGLEAVADPRGNGNSDAF